MNPPPTSLPTTSQKYGTLHEFACHPWAGTMLIFSVSFQFLVYVLPKRALIPIFLPGESPRTEEPGGLRSMGSQRVRYDCVTEQQRRYTGL